MKAALTALATVATRWPRASLAAVAVASLAGAALIVFGPLDISTSRRNLLSPEDPGQQRQEAFFAEFGRPDAAVFVLSGGTPEGRRAVAGELIARLPALPELRDRVMGRLDLSLLAEVLALHHPRLLDGFGDLGRAPPEAQGLPLLVRALERKVLDNLDGAANDRGDVAELARLAPLLRALDAHLRGEDTEGAWVGLAEANGLAASAGGARGKAEGRAGPVLDAHGYLMAGEGHLLVATFPDLESDEGHVVGPFIARMRAVRDAALAAASAPGVTAELTGLPALAADELDVIGEGLQLTTFLSTAGILLILFLAFRSLRQTLLALIPLGAGVFITLGIVELLYDGLNLITSSFVSVLMGLGIDLGVHLLYRYGEEQRAPGPRDDLGAMRRALVHAGPGVVTGAATTVIAFIAVATTEFTAFAELGVITSLGLLVMLVSAFLLIPPLMNVGRHHGEGVSPEFPGGGAAERLVTRRPRLVVALALGFTALAVALFLPTGPGYNPRYFDFIPDATESARALRILERDGALGPAVVNVRAPDLEAARALAARLRDAPEVGDLHTPTDLLPALDAERLAALRAGIARLGPDAPARLAPPATPSPPEALVAAAVALGDAFDELAFALEQGGRPPGPARDVSAALAGLRRTLAGLDDRGRARLAEVEAETLGVARRLVHTAAAVAARGTYAASDLPPLFQHRYLAKSGPGVALFVFPSGNIWDETFARRFVAAVEAVSPTASGLALDIVRHQDLIVRGFLEASAWAALFIVLFLTLVYRSARHALLAMLPLGLGWVWMVGAMKPTGLSFDVANLVALPLLLGIGIDAGAHVMHRYRESAAAHGGRARVAELVRGTGTAVLVSSLTTMVGFGALAFGGYGAMHSLGLLLVLGIAFTFLASTLLLPALLVLTGRAE